jgi:hypothetical protein
MSVPVFVRTSYVGRWLAAHRCLETELTAKSATDSRVAFEKVFVFAHSGATACRGERFDHSGLIIRWCGLHWDDREGIFGLVAHAEGLVPGPQGRNRRRVCWIPAPRTAEHSVNLLDGLNGLRQRPCICVPRAGMSLSPAARARLSDKCRLDVRRRPLKGANICDKLHERMGGRSC